MNERHDDLDLTLEDARRLLETGEPAQLVRPPPKGGFVLAPSDSVVINATRRFRRDDSLTQGTRIGLPPATTITRS